MRRVFVEQIITVYWKNKLVATALNIATGEAVTEIEVLEVRLTQPRLDESVLRQIDREIPYHILFLLTCDGKAQAWIGYKESAAAGNKAFKVNRYYHTPWMAQEELHFTVDGLDMDAVYESLARQIAGDTLQADTAKVRNSPSSVTKRKSCRKSRLQHWKAKSERKSNSIDRWK